MRQRRALFASIIILTAVAVSAPVVNEVATTILQTYHNGYCRYEFLGLDQRWWSGFPHVHSNLIGRRFYETYNITIDDPGTLKYGVQSRDPESAAWESYDIDFKGWKFEWQMGRAGQQAPFFAGDADHLFLVSESGAVFRLESSSCVEVSESHPGGTPLPYRRLIQGRQRLFFQQGKLSALVETIDGQFELFDFDKGTWQSQGLIKLLDSTRNWQISGPDSTVHLMESKCLSPVITTPGQSLRGDVQIVPVGSSLHVFWHVSDQLLYHPGIPMQEATGPLNGVDAGPDDANIVSASLPENGVGVAQDWFLVAGDLANTTKCFPIVVGGKPVVLLLDEPTRGQLTAKAIQFDEGKWSELARMDLPFPLINAICDSTTDGSVSYLIASGIWGRLRTYAIEPTGFRATKYQCEPWRGATGFIVIYDHFLWGLGFGLILATVVEALLWRESKRHQVRQQSIVLATIWERGLARGIDLLLIVSVIGTVSVALSHAWNVDWLRACEIRVVQSKGHPLIHDAKRIVVIDLVILSTMELMMIVMQGIWCRTPGKWLCGLRVLRTTLVRFGLRRSLLREILLCADSPYLLCWTPGILAMAFTERRQRLGDLVADTFVVRAKSIVPVPQMDERQRAAEVARQPQR